MITIHSGTLYRVTMKTLVFQSPDSNSDETLGDVSAGDVILAIASIDPEVSKTMSTYVVVF